MCTLLSMVFLSSWFIFQSQIQSKTPNETPSVKKNVPGIVAVLIQQPSKKERQAKPEVIEAVMPTRLSEKEEKRITAINLVRSIGRQADATTPLDNIKIKLQSAKLLTRVSPDDSRYLVGEAAELLLQRKKKEQNEDERKKLVAAESEVVALYSAIDPEKAEKFISEALNAEVENARNQHPNNASLAAKVRAERMVELASALIGADILSGADLLLSSVAETGRVAPSFYMPFRAAIGKPEMRDRISSRIKQTFNGKIVADPGELGLLAQIVIYISSKNNSLSAISTAILEIEINSLKQIEIAISLAREQGNLLPFTDANLDYLCGVFVSSLREHYSKWLPNRLEEVDLCLKKIQESVAFKLGEQKEKDKAETFQEKLDKAASSSSGSKRERELINLAFDVLNNRISGEKLGRDQMIDKILSALNSKDSKAFVEDAKIITSIKELTKEKKSLQAVNDARRISRDDWRAQVLSGLASSLEKIEPETAQLLYFEALTVLNTSKPSTAIIRTTLHIAERFYEKDSTQGRLILSTAIRYSNQTDFSEKGIRFPFDKNLVAAIGSISMILGFEPERIQDAIRDIDIGKMAQADWPVMYETSYGIENKTLRAIFQLKMCEGVINQFSNDIRSGK